MPDDGRLLRTIYGNRFSDEEFATKQLVWEILCADFFQRWVPRDGTVLDLGAGSCEFVNNIVAARRIAVDLNPDTASFARGAEVVQRPSTDLSPVGDRTVDTVFTSNFFEHLRSTDELLATLHECRRVLRPGGRMIVLMPNIRYLPGAYWDYLDHRLPLTHRSMAEALLTADFIVDEVVPRFLPYTVKDRRLPFLRPALRLYLRLPLAWRLVGRQMLVVAHRPD